VTRAWRPEGCDAPARTSQVSAGRPQGAPAVTQADLRAGAGAHPRATPHREAPAGAGGAPQGGQQGLVLGRRLRGFRVPPSPVVGHPQSLRALMFQVWVHPRCRSLGPPEHGPAWGDPLPRARRWFCLRLGPRAQGRGSLLGLSYPCLHALYGFAHLRTARSPPQTSDCLGLWVGGALCALGGSSVAAGHRSPTAACASSGAAQGRSWSRASPASTGMGGSSRRVGRRRRCTSGKGSWGGRGWGQGSAGGSLWAGGGRRHGAGGGLEGEVEGEGGLVRRRPLPRSPLARLLPRSLPHSPLAAAAAGPHPAAASAGKSRKGRILLIRPPKGPPQRWVHSDL